MSTVLVTAFEPFGGGTHNPSAAVLEGLRNRKGLHRLLLPVSFLRARDRLEEAIRDLSPDFVILTGLAGGRDAVCLEACALNVKDARIPDNDGEMPIGERLDADGENALFTALDLAPLRDRIRSAGIPARISYHAGTFVCNATYYALLRTGAKGLFVHLPDDERSVPDTPGAPFLKLEESLRAVELLIDGLTEEV